MAKKYAVLKKTTDGGLTATRVKTDKTYTPEDVRTGAKSYGKESTNPTPGFVKQAQSEKKDIVKKDGKPFRAGRTEFKHEYQFTTKVPKPDVKSLKVIQPKPAGYVAGKIKQKFTPVPKRKMERVSYLRNKDSGAGISKERRRPKKRSGY